MNFLAHAYLSFNHPGILTGNLISDFVKGRKQFDYPHHVRQGIILHRKIDEFTDAHEATKLSKSILRPHYRLYSGALVDVIYDHYVATEPAVFTEQELLRFSHKVYAQLDAHAAILPDSFSGMFPYMKKHNWLYNYRSKDGIERSLNGVMRRAKFLTESSLAFELFLDNYQLFRDHFRQLWADLLPYAENQYSLLK